jgi:hypothetical protein
MSDIINTISCATDEFETAIVQAEGGSISTEELKLFTLMMKKREKVLREQLKRTQVIAQAKEALKRVRWLEEGKLPENEYRRELLEEKYK